MSPKSPRLEGDEVIQLIYPIGNVTVTSRNPMLDSVVLMRFFELCDLSDLTTFRLVCKPWYELSLTRWRSKKTIIIEESEFLECDNYDLPEQRPKLQWDDVSELLNANKWNRLKSKPYRSYRLCDVNFERRSKEMKRFWRKCGPSMRNLDILASRVSCIESFKKAIFEDTPNLETLCIRILDFTREGMRKYAKNGGGGGDEEVKKVQPNLNLKCLTVRYGWEAGLPLTWRDLFEHFPNIENLELVGFHDESRVPSLVNTLEGMNRRNELNNTTIKSLNISGLYDQCPHVIQRLLELKQMKLESLSFGMKHCEVESHIVLARAIQLHGATLKKLHLKNGPREVSGNGLVEQTPYDNFPFTKIGLESLTELHLLGNTCSNLHFLLQTPNLRVFHICQPGKEWIIKGTDRTRLNSLILPLVEEFHFFYEVPSKGINISEENLRMLTRLMPNVRRLKAPLSAGGFQVVCQNWKGLTHLETFKGQLNDSVVTGGFLGKRDRVPNLTYLTDLRELSIGKCKKLTDVSIYNGFLKMPHLYRLVATFSAKTSEEAFDVLCKRFRSADLRHPVKLPDKSSVSVSMLRKRKKGNCSCRR